MNLVLTIAIGDNYQRIADLTAPSMLTYANKIKADFKCLTKQKIAKSYPYWEKFIINEFLDIYEKIIYFDIDIIIRPDCPNLFDLVPAEQLGLYNEGLLATLEGQVEHLSVMKKVFAEYNETFLKTWDGRFYNTGVMVVPHAFKDLFQKPDHEPFANFWDQSYLNMKLITQKKVSQVFDLGYKFNRMPYVDCLVKEPRTASYVIHYAGVQELTSLIRTDLSVWGKIYKK